MTFRINDSTGKARKASIAIICILFTYGLSAKSDEDTFDKVGNDTDRWIEIQTNLAKEKSLWESEKEILENSILVLDSERKTLEKALESNRLASNLYLKNETSISGQIEVQKNALEFARQEMDAIELRLHSAIEKLPSPIRREIESLIPKLAKEIDDQPVSIANRMQSLISILTMIDHFNNSLTLTHEIRYEDAERPYDTRILYWGLSMGFAVNVSASRAWRLTPGDGRWAWNDISDKADSIKALIDIYENDRKPEFIKIPATISSRIGK